MYSTMHTLLTTANLFTLISAHGSITSPTPRAAGSAMAAACGQQMYNNQAADSYGNIQGELQVTNGQSDYNAAACNVWTCKGFKYDDNKDNVQTYSVGDTVNIQFDIRAPHDGVANVSIVTSDGVAVSQPLISWDKFALNSIPLSQQTNETAFSITIPDVGDKCSTAGECVIQHFWDARSIDQTYESCIDVVIGGSGSGAGTGTGNGSSGSSSSAPAASSSSSSSPSSAATDPSGSSVLAPSSTSTSTALSISGVAASASPSITAPSLPINATTSTKKPCIKKPTGASASGAAAPIGTGTAPTSLPVPSGVAGIPTTLSTIAVPSVSPSLSVPVPSASGTDGVGTGSGAGASGSSSSIEQIIEMIMQLIEGLVGQG